MLTLTTVQMSQAKKLKAQGWQILDVTVKSATGVARTLAPTWLMVTGYKHGMVSKEEYSEKYLNILADSQANFPENWERFVNRDAKVALACYCPKGDFCHRVLLRDAFVQYATDRNIQVLVVEER